MKFFYWQCCLVLIAATVWLAQPVQFSQAIQSSQVSQGSLTLSEEEAFPITFGVSIAGAEFGCEANDFCNQNPGRVNHQYIYPGRSTIEPLAERGLRLMRIPVRWERLQPRLGEELDADQMRRLDETIQAVSDSGGLAIIDLHNYGRYRTVGPSGIVELIIDQKVDNTVLVSRHHLADFWRRIALRYNGNANVLAYALMNEPHDMGQSKWQEISQESVDSIRTVDRETWILVAGESWSSSERFEQANGPKAWITDESERIAYEAHCYLDQDASGHYVHSFAQELSMDRKLSTRPVERLLPFINWCKRNQVQGFVGEFGVPVHDPDWNELLSKMLETMKQSDLAGCCWAAGPWWNDYPMSVEVDGKTSDSITLQLLRQQR
ncbi:endoglucanase [Neorhodopirellula lusitana]|uniref:Endoglucanase n=1 Tax=Neorhodopirellula lusitana TaxID=445327 RepID=A0ABY1QFH8_9BACT|nr:endoglucanase [Neorhodopirellula lusitana]